MGRAAALTLLALAGPAAAQVGHSVAACRDANMNVVPCGQPSGPTAPAGGPRAAPVSPTDAVNVLLQDMPQRNAAEEQEKTEQLQKDVRGAAAADAKAQQGDLERRTALRGHYRGSLQPEKLTDRDGTPPSNTPIGPVSLPGHSPKPQDPTAPPPPASPPPPVKKPAPPKTISFPAAFGSLPTTIDATGDVRFLSPDGRLLTPADAPFPPGTTVMTGPNADDKAIVHLDDGHEIDLDRNSSIQITPPPQPKSQTPYEFLKNRINTIKNQFLEQETIPPSPGPACAGCAKG